MGPLSPLPRLPHSHVNSHSLTSLSLHRLLKDQGANYELRLSKLEQEVAALRAAGGGSSGTGAPAAAKESVSLGQGDD
jgi:hypothetical protein